MDKKINSKLKCSTCGKLVDKGTFCDGCHKFFCTSISVNEARLAQSSVTGCDEEHIWDCNAIHWVIGDSVGLKERKMLKGENDI